MINRLMLAAVFGFAMMLTAAIGGAQQNPGQPRPPRFDELVRADFFAGVAGNADAFDRAMKLIEATLAKDPRHAEALVWRGSGVIFRAQHAFQKSDVATGNALFQQGLTQMDDAVALAPDNVGVLIPRAATLLAVTRSLPDPARAKALLSTAVQDYEKVLTLQAPYFRYLSDHARGELLFGLAEGWHRLGNRDKARAYFERMQAEAKDSEYGAIARAWLTDPAAAAATQRGCVGCHAK
jgi:tetratricopeptide (TPR) repeat protein